METKLIIILRAPAVAYATDSQNDFITFDSDMELTHAAVQCTELPLQVVANRGGVYSFAASGIPGGVVPGSGVPRLLYGVANYGIPSITEGGSIYRPSFLPRGETAKGGESKRSKKATTEVSDANERDDRVKVLESQVATLLKESHMANKVIHSNEVASPLSKAGMTSIDAVGSIAATVPGKRSENPPPEAGGLSSFTLDDQFEILLAMKPVRCCSCFCPYQISKLARMICFDPFAIVSQCRPPPIAHPNPWNTSRLSEPRSFGRCPSGRSGSYCAGLPR